MKRNVTICLVIVVLLALTGVAGALPTTGAVTDIGDNNFVLHATGASGDTYFRWGIKEDWQAFQTPTTTPAGGIVETSMYGSPIMPSTQYYVKACDTTGCGNVVSFLTTQITLIVERTDEDPITNLTKSNFNLAYLPANLAYPYTILFPGQESFGIALVTGIIFTGFFVGFWIKSKSTHTGLFTGILIVSLLGTTGTAAMGIPPEFLGIAQGIMYAAIAGVLLSLLKK